MLIITASSGRNAGNGWRSIGRGDIELNLDNIGAARIGTVTGNLLFRELEDIGTLCILQGKAERHRFTGERLLIDFPGCF